MWYLNVCPIIKAKRKQTILACKRLGKWRVKKPSTDWGVTLVCIGELAMTLHYPTVMPSIYSI
jgi:hypothetical protein